MTSAKSQIRHDIGIRRAALDPQWIAAASARVAENLKGLEAFQSARTVALYKAIAGEVSLDLLFPECWKLGKRTCIPVFNARSRLYEMAEVATGTQYRIGNYGIREPLDPNLLSMDSIDLITVPGVAFDRNGNRLGRGGGYYDRLLGGFTGVSAAVSFEFQILPEIPCEDHDRPVDILVTETGIVNALNER